MDNAKGRYLSRPNKFYDPDTEDPPVLQDIPAFRRFQNIVEKLIACSTQPISLREVRGKLADDGMLIEAWLYPALNESPRIQAQGVGRVLYSARVMVKGKEKKVPYRSSLIIKTTDRTFPEEACSEVGYK